MKSPPRALTLDQLPETLSWRASAYSVTNLIPEQFFFFLSEKRFNPRFTEPQEGTCGDAMRVRRGPRGFT